MIRNTSMSSMEDDEINDISSISSLEDDEINDISSITHELEPITLNDPIDVWMDRLIELAVETHQHCSILATYENAYKEGVVNRTEVYEAEDEYRKAKREYVAFYADFYEHFILDTILSKSEIIDEAERYLVAYSKSDDAAGFGCFLHNEFEEKFKNELNGRVSTSESSSTNVTLRSSFETFAIGNNINHFFLKIEREAQSNAASQLISISRSGDRNI